MPQRSATRSCASKKSSITPIGSARTSSISRGFGPERNGSTIGTENSAATSHMASVCIPSAALMTVAPFCNARRVTSGFQESMLSGTPKAARAFTMPARRSHSSCHGTTVALSVEPWPPRSIPWQPLFSRYSPRRVAASGVVAIESVLSESGEAFTTPYKNMGSGYE